MSSAPKSSVPQKKSFAQVAAAANTTSTAKKPENGSPAPPVNITPSPPVQPSNGAGSPVAKIDGVQVTHDPAAAKQHQNAPPSAEHLNGLLQATHLDDSRAPDSALESLRKDNSDTKSVTSRTTLTIDEKESLRPDDSASVQAAHEDDGVSPPESLLAGSRPGTDTDFRAFRNQLYEIDRTGQARMNAQKPPLPSTQHVQAPIPTGPLVPASVPGQFPMPITPGSVQPRGDSSQLLVPPDEKLLEALASPKDRLFVLKIEQDMIDFVKDPKESFLQLPQLNTFYRLLSHKLADYYFLGHHYDESTASLRIYRTPNARLPAPLIGLDVGTPGTTTPPSGPTRKIMKRGNTDASGNDSGNVSLSASKAPSENDGNSGSEESKDPASREKSKALLSREERENRYKEARARIFAGFEDPEGKDLAEVANENDPSRASSTSGAKKSKKKKPKDDSFEARSAYTQVIGGQPFMPNSFVQMSQQQPAGYDQFAQYQAMASQPSQESNGPDGRSMFMPGVGMANLNNWQSQQAGVSYGAAPGGQAPYASPGYVGNNEAFGGMGGYQVQVTPRSNAANLAGYQPMQVQNENQGWYQMPMQQQFSMPNAQMGNVMMQPQQGGPMGPYMANMAPNQFGGYQYPAGSPFAQQRFNPQSQAFIPSVQGRPMPNNGAPFAGTSSNFGGGSPMQRQNSGQLYPPIGSPANGRKSGPGIDGTLSPSNRNQQSNVSSIAKWGTPPHLPPKPPPPATNNSLQARPTDMQQPLPANPNNKGIGRGQSNGVAK